MRVGIFGGSFDPPHNGHLLVAQDARDQLALDLMVVVPAATQPLKADGQTDASHRLAMTERCFAGLDGFIVDPIEIERGGLSFMVDTVTALHARWPAAAMHLLIGADVVDTLPRWRDPERLLSLAQLVILRRGAVGEVGLADSPPMLTEARSPVSDAIRAAPRLETRVVELSSTEVRRRVQEGRSIRGFVPAAVEAYIASAELYVRVPIRTDVAARA
jgi:nicotinate-nucleotide adenylyltransferase